MFRLAPKILVRITSKSQGVKYAPSVLTERFIDHGTISVDSTRYHSDANPGEISIGVNRSGGSDGAVAISYKTM